MNRSRAAAALFLLDCLFLGLTFNGLRGPWPLAAASSLLWACALFAPPCARSLPGRRLWMCWLLWSLASALASAEPLRGLAAFSGRATFVLFLAAAASFWRPPHRKLWLLFLGAAGLALGAAALCLRPPGYAFVGLLFPYYNYTAALEAALFAACLGALAGAPPPDGARKALLEGLMLFALAFLLAARSRGGLLACAAAGTVFALRRAPRAGALLALCAVTAAALLPKTVWVRPLKLSEPWANVRPLIWRSAFAVAADHPWLGEGPGQFDRGFLRHNFPAPPGTAPTRYGLRSAHAHSELLQAAAETGWPGALLLAAALCACAAGFLRRGGLNGSREPGLLACAALGAQALVDNIFNLPALGWLFASALASSAPESPSPRAPIPRPLLALGLLLSLGAWWPQWAVLELSGRGTVEGISAAMRLYPEDPDLWEELARAYLRLSPPRLKEALAALGQAELRNPTSAAIPLAGAEIQHASGNWAGELALSERALELEPSAPQARLQRAEALWGLGRKKESAQELAAFSAPPPRPWARGYEGRILRFDPERLRALSEAQAQAGVKPAQPVGQRVGPVDVNE